MVDLHLPWAYGGLLAVGLLAAFAEALAHRMYEMYLPAAQSMWQAEKAPFIFNPYQHLG